MQQYIPAIKDQLNSRTTPQYDNQYHLFAKNIFTTVFQADKTALNEKNMQIQANIDEETLKENSFEIKYQRSGDSIKEKIKQGLRIVLILLKRFQDTSEKRDEEFQKMRLKQYLQRKRNEKYQHIYQLDNYERKLLNQQKKMHDQQSTLYKQSSYYEQINNQKQQIKIRLKAIEKKQKEAQDLKLVRNQLKCREELKLKQLKSEHQREKQIEKQIEIKLTNLLQNLDNWKEKSFEWKQRISKQQRFYQDTKLKILQLKQKISKQGLMDEALRVENIQKKEEKQYQSASLEFTEYCKKKQFKVSPYQYIQWLKQQTHRYKIFLIRMQSSNNTKEINQKRRIQEQNYKIGSLKKENSKNKDKTQERIKNKIAFMKNKIENKSEKQNMNKKLKEQLTNQKNYLDKVQKLQFLLVQEMKNKKEMKIAQRNLQKNNSQIKYLELQKSKDDKNKTQSTKNDLKNKVRFEKKKQRSETTFYKLQKKGKIGFIVTLLYLLLLVIFAFYYTRIKIWMLINL